MSLLKEISSQVGTFEKIVQSGPLATQNFACNDISCATLNAQDKITTNQFQLVSAGSTDGYVLTSDTDGNAAWSPAPVPPPSVSLAYGSIAGQDGVSIANDDFITFPLSNTNSLGSNGFTSTNLTGFTIATSGIYRVDVQLNARNGAAAGTTQPITVALMSGNSYFLPLSARSAVAPSASEIMVLTASWVVRMNADNVIQIKNQTGASLAFDNSDNSPNDYYTNRLLMVTQLRVGF
jgi:hypothetical protein